MNDTAQLLRVFQQELLQRQQRAVLLCAVEHALQANELSPLQLDDQAHDRFAMHRYRDYLGASNRVVVLNFQHYLHADAIAALAGTVVAGGLLIVNMPAQQSAFAERLLRLAEPFALIIPVQQPQALPDALQRLLNSPVRSRPALPFPNAEQQQIVTTMQGELEHIHLLLADRGRGKSTTLGLALAGYSGSDRLIVTAPKRSQVDSVMQHANGNAEFIAWERLLDMPAAGIRLVIDEAAGLPIHILQQLCQRFAVWGIATTVEGYEGCGRGFVIRFMAWLQHHYSYHQHSLHQPLRWQLPDDCETWLNAALCLREATVDQVWQDGYQWRHASALTDPQLQQAMQLLLEAHYQSSPNDLRLLLDDPRQQLMLYCQHGQLVGLLWIAEEGPIAASLQQDILAGTRRPAGDLLPQALAYNWQQLAPMQWRWWRIVRITVAATWRRQRLGSDLLAQLKQAAQYQQIDAIGSSFGAAPELLAFWQANGFSLVHRGHKRQMASGYLNAMVAVGCSPTVQPFIIDKQLVSADLG